MDKTENSTDVETTNRHRNTPLGWREEPVGDADKVGSMNQEGFLAIHCGGKSK